MNMPSASSCLLELNYYFPCVILFDVKEETC